MTKVIDLDAHRSHCSGEVKCLACGDEGVAVWPAAIERLMECPECGAFGCVPIEAYPWAVLTLNESPKLEKPHAE